MSWSDKLTPERRAQEIVAVLTYIDFDCGIVLNETKVSGTQFKIMN
jgi:hypothetical protein